MLNSVKSIASVVRFKTFCSFINGFMAGVKQTFHFLNALNFAVNACINYKSKSKMRNFTISRGIWKYYLLKVVDILDTVFFILRKKNNQVTFLHVYHHAGMIMIAWIIARYVPGKYRYSTIYDLIITKLHPLTPHLVTGVAQAIAPFLTDPELRSDVLSSVCLRRIPVSLSHFCSPLCKG
ncbi:hypothetical protein ANN_11257 [Periplaneta americana]|uniref:Elongation of very long chain fatty acids protein n=1 Tax=Periplaneta americana TaxID=6978 RepID=A0ABQ8T4I9_PERAM|nr:hypothetical protein ANN_11257 [Periplaneta americana]